MEITLEFDRNTKTLLIRPRYFTSFFLCQHILFKCFYGFIYNKTKFPLFTDYKNSSSQSFILKYKI